MAGGKRNPKMREWVELKRAFKSKYQA